MTDAELCRRHQASSGGGAAGDLLVRGRVILGHVRPVFCDTPASTRPRRATAICEHAAVVSTQVVFEMHSRADAATTGCVCPGCNQHTWCDINWNA